VVELEENAGFVVADIPGLIEGASSGAGLGFEFLRHIERTKVLLLVVDAAGTEGRDPLADVQRINEELFAYNPELAKRKQIIAANKCDLLEEDVADSIVDKLKAAFEPEGIPVFAISALTGAGIKPLLYHVRQLLDELGDEPTVYEAEYSFEDELLASSEPYTVAYDEKAGEYVVEGPRVERMLGYTNLEAEKGFLFFQRFLKETGILEKLEEMGIAEGDTVRLYGLSFEYFK
jgi:GTP-binding protein